MRTGLWLAWDGGNLANRKRFDALLGQVSTTPMEARDGLQKLLEMIRDPSARIEVRHQLALATYASGSEAQAAELMQQLVQDVPDQTGLKEDYAVMTYNLAQKLRQSGDLKNALAYLLQCASLEVRTAVRAAFDAAYLLHNNPKAAIRYAHQAEAGMELLNEKEQQALLRYLAELYRRVGNRDRAKEYITYLRELKRE